MSFLKVDRCRRQHGHSFDRPVPGYGDIVSITPQAKPSHKAPFILVRTSDTRLVELLTLTFETKFEAGGNQMSKSSTRDNARR